MRPAGPAGPASGPAHWNPAQYARYATHRARPFHELLARVPPLPGAPPRVADLGCGAGGPSAQLLRRWPDAHVTGYDSSPSMLSEAVRDHAGPTEAGGSLDFVRADLADWPGPRRETFDLIISNAALHWLPGHTVRFADWLDALPAGGVLAFQVPGNFTAPSHTILAELRDAPRWRDRLGTPARNTVWEPGEYLAELARLGCDVDAWETTYQQVLPGEDAVLEWVRGTTLRPVLTLLADEPEARAAFLEEYAARLREAYPRRAYGTVYPFRRIFVVAVRR
ncbi:trans-aconitate methyltransferase [Streptomyces oceani]|uniref:Trans-aconitate 2-methyltransferase n=1 Tax=Streptomyces oceani TaxID=1075402 RepID=A0A1E7KMV8_9ACTN|nr:trans-aconitate methyltransferase [Streptomyces oceani]